MVYSSTVRVLLHLGSFCHKSNGNSPSAEMLRCSLLDFVFIAFTRGSKKREGLCRLNDPSYLQEKEATLAHPSLQQSVSKQTPQSLVQLLQGEFGTMALLWM